MRCHRRRRRRCRLASRKRSTGLGSRRLHVLLRRLLHRGGGRLRNAADRWLLRHAVPRRWVRCRLLAGLVRSRNLRDFAGLTLRYEVPIALGTHRTYCRAPESYSMHEV